MCDVVPSRYLSLVDHERTGHPGAFLCILCGLPCYSADALIFHSETHHPRTSTYLCRSEIATTSVVEGTVSRE